MVCAAPSFRVEQMRAGSGVSAPPPALTTMRRNRTMATKALCSIDGCYKPRKGLGYCSAHYAKQLKYGNPLAVFRKQTVVAQCIFVGCDRQGSSTRGGLCGAHYKRKWRHGDPAGVRKMRANDGEPLLWLKDHVSYDGDDCLKWPFADRGSGYGAVNDDDGVTSGAHRLMCILAHGEPSGPRDQAAHSCGRGHMGCVNPRHLRWATKAENAADRVGHGTHGRGEANGNALLTNDQARAVRSAWPRRSQNQLARQYGVSQTQIWKIVHGMTYRDG